jgi:hypothetical protein
MCETCRDEDEKKVFIPVTESGQKPSRNHTPTTKEKKKKQKDKERRDAAKKAAKKGTTT